MSQQRLEKCERFLQALPHARKLQLKTISAEEGRVTMELPVQAQLQGPAANTYLHGGVLTTLVDTACSGAVICMLDPYELSPTLDLRIDHMTTACADKPLFVDAECYRKSRNVLFTRATVYQDSPEQPIAYAIATFMRLGAEITDKAFRNMVEGEA